MTRRLERALRDAPVPGEAEARDRAWGLARAAFAQRDGPPRSLRASVRPRLALRAIALVVAAGAIAVAVALTPPGEAVAMWVKNLVVPERPGRPEARPGLRSLPAAGRLLVTSPGGVWIVAGDGAQRRLGSWTGASWSPHGLFVAAWRGDRLAALDPHGTARWTLTRRRPVHAARWSPDGVLVAYLSATTLRVVYGNGIHDRRLARRTGPAAPAWSPRAVHQLAYAGSGGRVHVVDGLWGVRSWRSAPGAPVEQLAWSAGGRRLVALAGRELRIFSSAGRVLRRVRARAGMRNVAVAFPGAGGGDPVLLRRDPRTGRSEIVSFRVDGGPLREHRLFSGPGRMSDVAFAPDGRWLLVGWRDADQWVFLHLHDAHVRAVSGVGSQFSPGTPGRSAYPRVWGWCC